jgi:hypothetical protein
MYDRSDPLTMVKKLEDTNMNLANEAVTLRYREREFLGMNLTT